MQEYQYAQIACGSFSYCHSTNNNDVLVFGYNRYGQLGLGHDKSQNSR